MAVNPPQRIGLIAGAGEIPVYFAKQAQARGWPVVSIGFTDEISDRLKPLVEKSYSIGVTKVGKILQTMKNENVKDLLIVGKVEKKMIFKLQMFDLDTLKMLMSLKAHQDKTVMIRIFEEIESRGFHILDQMDYLHDLFPSQGVLTRKQPSDKEMEDVTYGMPLAKYMADQEIGQTIVVKNKTVIAVEAVEGTDVTLERGCELANGKCTAIKVSRTDQDYRFDSPGIGPNTIQRLIDGKASVLALEAGRVMIIERDRVVEMADRAGLAVICV